MKGKGSNPTESPGAKWSFRRATCGGSLRRRLPWTCALNFWLMAATSLVGCLLSAAPARSERTETATPDTKPSPLKTPTATTPTKKASQGPGDESSLVLSWSAGAGYDSNPTRVDPCAVSTAPHSAFTLATGELTFSLQPKKTDRLEVAYLAGARLHGSPKAQGEDVFKHRLQASWSHLFLENKSLLVLSGLYWESWEKTLSRERLPTSSSGENGENGSNPGAATTYPELQDYRYSGLQGSYLSRIRPDTWAALSLTTARFDYRPAPSLSFTSLGFGGELRHKESFGSALEPQELELRTSYSLEAHFYPPPTQEGRIRRRDTLHSLTVEASYLGSFLAGVSYSLKANLSGDSVWTMTRHTLTAHAAVGLPWNLVSVMKAVYQHLDYPGALLLYAPTSPEPFLQLDEESRSSVLFSLQRPLAKGLHLNVIYKVYLGKTQGVCDELYSRHVATLELTGEMDLLK